METDVVTSCLMISTSSTTGLRVTLSVNESFMVKAYKIHVVRENLIPLGTNRRCEPKIGLGE